MNSSDDSSEHSTFLELLSSVSFLRYRPRMKSNPLDDLTDTQVILRFRFSKDSIHYLHQNLEPLLSVGEYRKSTDIPPLLQLLTALRFYATGTFQVVVADLYSSSQPSCSRIIKNVSRAIASLRSTFIKYPRFDEANNERLKFSCLAGFPGVVGAVDCTHVKIHSPGGPDSELFRNRKNYHSINVQAVCTADLRFTNVVARWPGSVHDSRIFDNCLLRDKLGNQEIPGILVGDSGYPNLPYLLTPITNAETAAEKRYNHSHAITRNTIERAFGVLKRRFFCLGSELRTSLNTTLTVIVACFVLHNCAKFLNEPDFDEPTVLNPDVPVSPSNSVNSSGNAFRNSIISNHFN